jgi:hypothetical protein
MAAGEVLKEFLARLGFEIDEAGAQKFTSWLGTATTRSMAFGAVIMAAAGAVYAGVYKIAESNAQLLSMAEALNMNVAKLREMNFVANLTGASAEALKSSLQGLQAQMAGATIGQGGIATFARLGIHIKDANGKLRDTGDVLLDVGAKIKKMDRPRAEMFLGQLGIDKSLYKMLTRDVSGLTEAYRDMYAATGMDAQKSAEQSRDFVQEVKLLKEVFKLLAESVGIALIGKAGKDVTEFRKKLLKNFKPIMAVLLGVIKLILRVAGFVGAMADRVIGWIGGIVRWFQTLDSSTQTLILGVLGFAAAWKYLNLAFLATPIGAIITGIIALVAIIDDLMTYMEGGESLIDWGPWVGQIETITGEFGKLMDVLGALWNLIKGPLLEAFAEIGNGAIDTLSGILNVVLNLITMLTNLANLDWTAAWESALKLAQGILDTILGIAKATGITSAVKGVARIFGGSNDGPPALGPSPAFAAAAAGAAGAGKTELNANTTVYVDGAGDPEATARAVARQQTNVNADLVRNTRGAAR